MSSLDPYTDLLGLAARGIDWGGRTGQIPRRGARPVRPAAVLVLFGVREGQGGSDVLLVERASTLNDHPGQIAFPGGRVDPEDAGPVAAALREAREETGLDPDGVEVLGTLPALPLAVSNHRVTPVLGWWRVQSPVRAVDAAESSHVFRAPVADLLDARNRVTATISRDAMTHKSPAFTIDGHLIWGFTGIVLDAIFTDLAWTHPWDRTRELTIPV